MGGNYVNNVQDDHFKLIFPISFVYQIWKPKHTRWKYGRKRYFGKKYFSLFWKQAEAEDWMHYLGLPVLKKQTTIAIRQYHACGRNVVTRPLADNFHLQATKCSRQKHYFKNLPQQLINIFETLVDAIDELITQNHQEWCRMAEEWI